MVVLDLEYKNLYFVLGIFMLQFPHWEKLQNHYLTLGYSRLKSFIKTRVGCAALPICNNE